VNMELKSNASIVQSQLLLILQKLHIATALTVVTKLFRSTKWQDVLFPCRFAQLSLYGFASVVVDELPNCHRRLSLHCLVILQISNP
jgi:hypothetical protein